MNLLFKQHETIMKDLKSLTKGMDGWPHLVGVIEQVANGLKFDDVDYASDAIDIVIGKIKAKNQSHEENLMDLEYVIDQLQRFRSNLQILGE